MTPCTDRKHQAMKDDGYAKCWDCGESFYAERKPPVVASDVLLADLMAVEEIARVAPELNPSNYDNDDVCRLNTAMCELYEVVRKYRPMANPTGQGMTHETEKEPAVANNQSDASGCGSYPAPGCSRFRIEERSGIVAIYDTHHPEYSDTPGCHADYPWTVCHWHGRYATPPDPECVNETGNWTVEKRWIEKAQSTLDLLNRLHANPAHLARTTPEDRT